jgi:hypothetical protein
MDHIMEATIHAQQFDSGGVIQHIFTITQKGLKLLHNALVFKNYKVFPFLSSLVLFVNNQE